MARRSLPPFLRALAKAQGIKAPSPSPSKFNNIVQHHDGYRFASKGEARRYGELKNAALAGEIIDLVVHPAWTFEHNGVKIGRYTADFSYRKHDGSLVVEDVKSNPTKTEAYGIRKRLMLAFFGIEIREVFAK